MHKIHGLQPDTAQIEWRNGLPYASLFEDVYFSSDDGLAETDYVFLQGNQLAKRWENLTNQHFTIAETGFGTGLNFLCATQLWLKTAPESTILHFISTEKYPLSIQDMKKSLKLWPILKNLSDVLDAHYKLLLNQHATTITLFNKRVKLSLLLGDAASQLAKISAPVNAWFLDGFAPSKNPEMWQPALFKTMAKLSTEGTTLATFTSASAVRLELTAAGFSMQKRAGFGKKREMLIGNFKV